MLKWPGKSDVEAALERWAVEEIVNRPQLKRLGYFGSYANATWGVGSDLDLVAVVRDASASFERRGLEWDLSGLPVPAEILVYTEAEWAAMMKGSGRFARMLREECVWIFERR